MQSSNFTNKRREDVEKEDLNKNTMTQFETKNITRLEFVQKKRTKIYRFYKIKKIFIKKKYGRNMDMP